MQNGVREPFYSRWGFSELVLIFSGPLLLIILFNMFFSPEGVWAPLISGLIQALGLLLFTWLFIVLGFKYDFFGSKFLGISGFWGKILKWSFILWFGATIINFLFQLLMAWLFDLTPQPQEIISYIVTNVEGVHIILYAILIVVLAPLAEEVFFRGLLYTYLRNWINIGGAALISSCLFALAHGEIWAFLPTFLAGLGFTFVFEKAKSLWAPIIAHVIWNGMGLLIVFFAMSYGIY